MTVPPDRITLERLARWRRMLDAEEATPVLVLGVSNHDGTAVQVLVPEDVDTVTIIALLQLAIKQLAASVPMNYTDRGSRP